MKVYVVTETGYFNCEYYDEWTEVRKVFKKFEDAKAYCLEQIKEAAIREEIEYKIKETENRLFELDTDDEYKWRMYQIEEFELQ